MTCPTDVHENSTDQDSVTSGSDGLVPSDGSHMGSVSVDSIDSDSITDPLADGFVDQPLSIVVVVHRAIVAIVIVIVAIHRAVAIVVVNVVSRTQNSPPPPGPSSSPPPCDSPSSPSNHRRPPPLPRSDKDGEVVGGPRWLVVVTSPEIDDDHDDPISLRVSCAIAHFRRMILFIAARLPTLPLLFGLQFSANDPRPSPP
jgi:hypothetical protein